MFQLERVYDHLDGQGRRFLVERLWPRGVRKEALRLDGWLRDVAPSAELRKWFAHDPARWDEFRSRYESELEASPDSWAPLLVAGREGKVTLLFSSRDAEHNNVVALKDFLERKLSAGGGSGATRTPRSSRSSRAKRTGGKRVGPKRSGPKKATSKTASSKTASSKRGSKRIGTSRAKSSARTARRGSAARRR